MGRNGSLTLATQEKLKALGRDITRARREFRASISEVAEELNLTPADISDAELGRGAYSNHLKRICAHLGVEIPQELRKASLYNRGSK